VLLPIFAVLLGWPIQQQDRRPHGAWLLDLAFLSAAGTMLRPNIIFARSYSGLLGFHLFAAALAVLDLRIWLINEPRTI
jgi:hypothetical protein